MNKIHFIGIGGDGMSGLARVLFECGYKISGSNIEENRRTQELRNLGIEVFLEHSEANLEGADTVVFSSAIAEENVELASARRRGLKIFHRLEMLAKFVNNSYAVGVAGTHGKTTTTAMIATLLERSGLQPTFFVGAPCPSLKTNARLGAGEYLVVEVDESDGHFTKLRPQIAVITNIGLDHLNYYHDEAEICEEFAKFLAGSRKAILCADDPNCQKVINRVHRRTPAHKIMTFGLNTGDLRAENIEREGLYTRFVLRFRGEKIGKIELQIPGRHNVYNALAAMLAGYEVGLEFTEMATILRDFRLPERRFQILSDNGIMVIDDYAHLPEQIELNLKAIREGWGPRRRVIALFQPHRFTRTKYINGRFSSSFDLADIVVVTEIYPAFEKPIPGIDAQIIVEAIKRRESNRNEVHYIPEKERICDFLQELVQPEDFIIGFGAGDIWKVLYKFVASWQNKL